MILIINSGSIKNKAEDNINNEIDYHLHSLNLIMLHFQHENIIYTSDNVMYVVGGSEDTSAYGDTYQCYCCG